MKTDQNKQTNKKTKPKQTKKIPPHTYTYNTKLYFKTNSMY